METIYSFSAPYQPSSGIIQTGDGRFYGTAASDATTGIAFNIDVAGNMTILHHFTGLDGNHPSGGLLQATDGNFYGTTRIGGAHSYGCVYKLDSSGTLTLLYSFDLSDGANPYASLVQATDGSFYGTTKNGGASGLGTIFKIDSSGNLTTLHSFTGVDGANPVAGLIEATDGNFYATTSSGGAANLGTVFRMDSSGNITVLHSFSGDDGQAPLGTLLETSNGNFYGTTSAGGSNGSGTIFETDSTGGLTTLHALAWAEGTASAASLIQATDGRLYGTAAGGGHASGGTIFSTDLAGNLVTLWKFGRGSDGSSSITFPEAGLTQASDGFFYGTTSSGGASNMGTVFRMNAQGQTMTLHSFSGSDGAYPTARVIQATDGSFYGTTFGGGLTSCPGDCGTVFKIDSSGNFTSLYSFLANGSWDGSKPHAGLLQASDGNFYGTTTQGGSGADGTIFKIDTSGNETLLHSFYGITNGADPRGDLIQGAYGFIYGTTLYGDSCILYGGCGTAFQMDSNNIVAILHNFGNSSSDGFWPRGGVIQVANQDLYGTTSSGGNGNGGVLYRIRSGALSVIHAFMPTDGSDPEASLLQASDGSFYGTTAYDGASNAGTLFGATPAGGFTNLHDFSGPDGSRSFGALIQGLDGRLYGTTTTGGANGQGTIFAALPPGISSVSSLSVQCGPPGSSTHTTASGTFSGNQVTATLGGVSADVISYSTSAVEIGTPPGNPGELADLTITEVNGPTVTLQKAFLYDYPDVPSGNPFHDFVCAIVRNGLSAGCGAGNFCPANPMLRSQMAVFLLTGEHGSVYFAPSADCATYPFTDVPCPSVFANYILQLYDEGITGGCATNPLRFCPNDPVTRADMAVFLLMAEHGTGYTPPACTGIFADVPCPGPFTNWIEALYSEGVTAGCSTNPLTYCPQSPVTRAQMAVFLTATFTLQ